MQKVSWKAYFFLSIVIGPHICILLDTFAEEKLPEIPALASSEFNVTSREYVHGNVKISVTNAKRLPTTQVLPPSQFVPTPCVAWLSIRSTSGKELSRMVFDTIEPHGGNYGLFVLPVQPSKELFIIAFRGNYDDKFVVIDKDGKILLLSGTGCFQTRDKRYLVTQCLDIGYAILDLKTRAPVTSKSIDGVYGKGLSGLHDVYYSESLGYFSFDDPYIDARSPDGKSDVFVLDPATGKITRKEIARSIIKSAEVVVKNLDIVINGKSIEFTENCTCN
jgi:hypothetical protein